MISSSSCYAPLLELVWKLVTGPCRPESLNISRDGNLYYICEDREDRFRLAVSAVDPTIVVTPSPSGAPSTTPTLAPSISQEPTMTSGGIMLASTISCSSLIYLQIFL